MTQLWRLFFGSYYSKIKSKRVKNKQVGLHLRKKPLHRKKKINKMKRQRTEWGKIFSNHVSNKCTHKACPEKVQPLLIQFVGHRCNLAAKESGLECTCVNNDEFTVLVSGGSKHH